MQGGNGMSSSKFVTRGWLAATLASTTLGGVVAITATHSRAADTTPGWGCPAPRAVPAGFGYPQSPQTIAHWVQTRDAKAARAHGWGLFAALNTATAGVPVWQSWCTETQAFQQSAPAAPHDPTHGERPMRTFKLANGPTVPVGPNEPINFAIHPVYPIPAAVLNNQQNPNVAQCVQPAGATSPIATLGNGPQFQNNGDIMVAGVIYNDAAYRWIRQQQLYDYATLNALQPKPPVLQTAIPAMPPGSIALKPMMWPVKATGYTALPVWDDQAADNNRYTGFEVQAQWPRAVAVTTAAGGPATVPVTYLNGVWEGDAKGKPIRLLPQNSYRNAPTVGIDRFYHYQPQLASMNPCDRAILDASANYAYGRNFEQGDQLVLIAMHIMTKEQPSWTFQSLWWSDRPDQGPYAADRPALPGAQGPWRQYLMTSTYGWPAVPGGSTWPVAYNPYIELAADHPIRTNCMNCHHRAAWPETGDSYLTKSGYPTALDVFSQGNPGIFNGKLKVDSLWSIADRVPSTPSPSPTAGSGAGGR